jgi:hypothetical protein
MPIILTIQEAENRRILVKSKPKGNSSQDTFCKNNHKKRLVELAQGVSPEFKPQY